jgi:hypothetical protein
VLSALIGGLLDVVVENLPQLEQLLGRAAFLVECERLLHLLGNTTLAVQAAKVRLMEIMRENDAAVDAARKTKDPHDAGGGGNG